MGSVKIGEKVVKLKHMKQGLRSSVTCKFNISHQFLLVITDSWCVCVCVCESVSVCVCACTCTSIHNGFDTQVH